LFGSGGRCPSAQPGVNRSSVDAAATSAALVVHVLCAFDLLVIIFIFVALLIATIVNILNIGVFVLVLGRLGLVFDLVFAADHLVDLFVNGVDYDIAEFPKVLEVAVRLG
jgi:hypothetical protein